MNGIAKTGGCSEALQEPLSAFRQTVKLVTVVAGAILDSDGRVLITRRPEGKPMAGLWEFPGGKIDPGESPEYALSRELEEELGIQTRPCCFSPVSFVSHAYSDFHLLMPLFACRMWEGTVTAREGQTCKWVRPQDLYDYAMPAADLPLIGPLVDFV